MSTTEHPPLDHGLPVPERILGRGTIMVFSALVSPVMLSLLFTSATLLQEASITGTPLGSPGGQIGVLVVAIMIILIAYSSRWSPCGIIITTIWSGAFAVYYTVNSFRDSFPATTHEALLGWQQLPLQTFCVFFTAMMVTLSKRRQKVRNTPRKYPEPAPVAISLFFTVSLLFSFALICLVLAAAPTTIAPIILGDPHLLPVVEGSRWILVAMTSVSLIALTATATRSVLAVQLTAWFVLLIPALFLAPLFSTLTGILATPQNRVLIAFSYSMPVLGIFGLLIATCTYSISLVEQLQAQESGHC